MTDVVSPVFHEQVRAPPAVSVAEEPLQTEVSPEIVMEGKALTVIVQLFLELHPAPLIPVTVQVAEELGETVMTDVVAPVLQEQVMAPLAVSVAEEPLQTEATPEIVMDGKVFTVIVWLVLELHPAPLIPVTVYVAEELGETVMTDVVSPVLHEQVRAPSAVSVAEEPLQTDVTPEIVMDGKAFTVIVWLVLELHPAPLIPVTVYVAEELGETVMTDVVSPVLHEQVMAPPAVSVAEEPLQTDVTPEIDMDGKALTVIVQLFLELHPAPLIPVTVQVAEELGETVMTDVVSPVLHEQVRAPPAVSVAEEPLQTEVTPEIIIDGKALTVIV